MSKNMVLFFSNAGPYQDVFNDRISQNSTRRLGIQAQGIARNIYKPRRLCNTCRQRTPMIVGQFRSGCVIQSNSESDTVSYDLPHPCQNCPLSQLDGQKIDQQTARVPANPQPFIKRFLQEGPSDNREYWNIKNQKDQFLVVRIGSASLISQQSKHAEHIRYQMHVPNTQELEL